MIFRARRRLAGERTSRQRAACAWVAQGRGAAAVAVCTAVLLSASACGGHARRVSLIYADSLIVSMGHVADRYAYDNPGVHVTTESHGSIQVIRQVTDLHRRFDVVVTADASLIPSMMEHAKDPASGLPYADWYVDFATTRMVLAWSPKGRLAGRISSANWWRLLAERSVRVGIADPRFDAAGYRALMVLQLAEWLYDDPTLVEDLTLGQFDPTITTQRVGDGEVITVPALLDTTGRARIVMRGAAIELLPLLESGDIDCAFEYENVARQQGVPFIELPPQVDLGSSRYESLYRRVTVKIDLRRFASVNPVFTGGEITYAVTIPTNAPDAVRRVASSPTFWGRPGGALCGQTANPR